MSHTGTAFRIASTLLGLLTIGGSIRLWSQQPPELALQAGHSSSVMSLKFSDDGQYLISTDMTGGVAVWSLNSYMEMRSYRLPQNTPNAITLDPGFQLQFPDFAVDAILDIARDFLVTSSLQGPVRVWRLSSGQLAATLTNSMRVSALAMNRDHSQLVGKSNDGEMIFWDTITWTEIGRLTNGTKEEDVLSLLGVPDALNTERQSVGFNLDFAYLWSVSRSAEVDTWNIESQAHEQRHPPGKPRIFTISSVSYSAKLFVGGDIQQSTIVLKDLSGVQPDRTFDAGKRLSAFGLNQSGTKLVVAGRDSDLDVWDLSGFNPQKTATYDCGPLPTVVEFSHSSGEEQLAVGTGSGKICVWATADNQPKSVLSGVIATPLYVEFIGDTQVRSIDRGLIDASHVGARDWTWDFMNNVRRMEASDSTPPTPYALIGYVGSRSFQLRDNQSWSFPANRPVNYEAKVPLSGKTTMDIASHNGKLVIQGDNDGAVRLYDNPVVRPPWRDAYLAPKVNLQSTGSRIIVAEFSPDDGYVAVGSQDGTVILYRLSDSHPFVLASKTNRAVRKLVFDSHGQFVAIGDNLGSIGLYDSELHVFKLLRAPSSAEVTGIAFSHNAPLLAYADGINSIDVWDLQKNRLVRTIENVGAIQQLAINADGSVLAAVEADGAIHLLKTNAGMELATLIGLTTERDYLVVSSLGWFDGTADGAAQAGWRVGKTLDVVSLDSFYNEFFAPNLMRLIIQDKVPIPPKGSIADLLALPGTAAMLTGGKATIEKKNGKLILCLAAGANVEQQTTALMLFHRGRRQDLLAVGFEEDPVQQGCRYRKEVVDDGQQWEFVGRPAAQSAAKREVTQLAESRDSGLYVMSVGITEYPGFPYPRLPNPARDAKDFAEALPSAPTEHFTNVHNVHLLMDSDATLAGIRTALDQLASTVKEDDVVILFLSGHGTVPPGQEMFYFIPYFKQKSSFDRAFDEKRSALNMAVLADAVRRFRSRRILLVVDACESGGLIDSLAKIAEIKEQAESDGQGAGRAKGMSGMFILAAATPVEEAADPADLGHGVLTSTVLSYLRLPGEKTANGLRQYVESTLPDLAKRYHLSQTPLSYGSGVNFYLK